MIKSRLGVDFPRDADEQLWKAIGAVFNSWHNERAETYRRLNNIPATWGTAVNVQAMVFGNLGDDSGTGVAFTRNPATGENVFYGEYLMKAQGEDVVAGIRTPQPINKWNKVDPGALSLEEEMPALYVELEKVRSRSREPLRRYAGSRIHDSERAPVDSPDALRQANGFRRDQDRDRHGAGRAHREGRGDSPDRARTAQPVPPPRVRSRRQGRRDSGGEARGARASTRGPGRRRGRSFSTPRTPKSGRDAGTMSFS